MDSTSASLLLRARDLHDNDAWTRIVDLYRPFLLAVGTRMGLSDSDAADLAQDALTLLARQLPEFEYDQSKSFRAWLKTIACNRAKNMFRAAAARPSVGAGSQAALKADAQIDTDLFEQREYAAYVTKRMLQLIRQEFAEDVWSAFEMLMLQDRKPTEVAEHLGITVNRVYLAKSRVLRRLRAETQYLLD